MNAEEFSPRATALALLAALALAGCAVGPDFKRPESSTPDVFQRLQSAQSESRPVDAIQCWKSIKAIIPMTAGRIARQSLERFQPYLKKETMAKASGTARAS